MLIYSRNIKSSLPVEETEFESQNLVGPYTFFEYQFSNDKRKKRVFYKD